MPKRVRCSGYYYQNVDRAEPGSVKRRDRGTEPTKEQWDDWKMKMTIENPSFNRLYDRARYHDNVREIFDFFDDGAAGWRPPIPEKLEEISKHMLPIEHETNAFAVDFAISTDKELAHLSKAQKNFIIASLEGYCIQEDWDSLIKRFPAAAREAPGEVFVQALLGKALYENLFERQFWYLDGKMSADDEEGDPDFGARLQYLYERFFKTSPFRAGLWRSEAVRMSNSTTWLQTNNIAFGLHNQRRKEKILERMAEEILTWEPLRLLLKKPEDAEDEAAMRKHMITVFKHSAQVFFMLETERGDYRLTRLDDFREDFTIFSTEMQAHQFHLLVDKYPDENHRLDKARPVLVVHPGLNRSHVNAIGVPNPGSATWASPFAKALVILHDPDGGHPPPIPSDWKPVHKRKAECDALTEGGNIENDGDETKDGDDGEETEDGDKLKDGDDGNDGDDEKDGDNGKDGDE